MFDDATGCYAPNWPDDMERTPRMTVTKFGDGYEQRVLDGINWMDTLWKLKWEMRPRSIVLDMDLYLSAQMGHSFPFYDPRRRTTVNVFCDNWTVTWNYRGQSDQYGDLQADFRYANGLGINWPGP
jgi:phage-related protein